MSLKDWLNSYGHSREDSVNFREKEDPDYKQGLEFLNSGNIELAINSFEKVIEKNPDDAIESYLQIGTLKKRQHEPFEAVAYLNKYLRRANLNDTTLIEDMINGAKEDYLSTLPGRPYETYKLSETVEKKYKEVREENDSLKRRLALADARIKELESYAATPSARPPVSSVTVVKPTPTPAPVVTQPEPAPQTEEVKTYIVQAGDTLGKISRKFYGTSGRWQEIYNYNRDVLSDPAKLKLGMELKIPPR